MPNYYLIGEAIGYLTKVASSKKNKFSYSMTGKLVLSKSGYLVLTVPSQLINGIFDTFNEPGLEKSKQSFVHVISPVELKDIDPSSITERGHSFNYLIGGLRELQNPLGYSKVLYLHIISPDLKKLRHSYGLSPFPNNSDSFKLPIAVRKVNVLSSDNEVTKISSYEELSNEFDMEKVKNEILGYLNIQN